MVDRLQKSGSKSIPRKKFYKVVAGVPIAFDRPGLRLVQTVPAPKGDTPFKKIVRRMRGPRNLSGGGGGFGRYADTKSYIVYNLEAGKKGKKIDFIAIGKKFAKGVGNIAKVAVKFALPLAKVASAFFPGASILVTGAEKLAKLNETIKKGREAVKAKGGAGATDLVNALRSENLPFAVRQTIAKSVVEGKPIELLNPQGYAEKKVAQEEIKQAVESKSTPEGSATTAPVETPQGQEVLRLVETSGLQVGPTKDDEKRVELRNERKKLIANVKKVEGNIKTVTAKAKKYTSGAIEKDLVLRVYNVRDRLAIVKKEVNAYGSLGAVPLIGISLDSGIRILRKYDDEVVALNKELVAINNSIDTRIGAKSDEKQSKETAKYQKTMRKYDTAREREQITTESKALAVKDKFSLTGKLGKAGSTALTLALIGGGVFVVGKYILPMISKMKKR